MSVDQFNIDKMAIPDKIKRQNRPTLLLLNNNIFGNNNIMNV